MSRHDTANDRVDLGAAALRFQTESGLGSARAAVVRARVLEEVSRRAERPRQLVWAWAGSLAVLLLAAGGALLWWQTHSRAEPVARLVVSSGAIAFAPTLRPTGAGRTGIDVVAGADGAATLAVPRRGKVTVGADTRLRVIDRDRIEMAAGTATFDVLESAEPLPLTVTVGVMRVIVSSGRFAVRAEAQELRLVEVDEGVVDVVAQDQRPTRLVAGRSWRPAESELEQSDAPRSGVADKGATEPSSSATEARARAHRGATHRADPATWVSARDSLAARRCDEVEPLVTKLVSQTPVVEEQCDAELLSVECWLRSGDNARAAAVYDRVLARYRGAGCYEAALFEIGRLRFEQGDLKDAARRVDEYLSRYPRGAYTDPTRFRRCELDASLGHADTARTCMEKYRAQFPKGLRFAEATWWLAERARSDDRWLAAAVLYEEAASLVVSRDRREEAQYYRVWCFSRAGAPEVRVAAADYLKDNPHGRFSVAVQELGR